MLGFFAFDLGQTLDGMIENSPELRGSSYGISITRMDGSPVFQRRDDVRLVPASNEKLLSACFALDSLGPNFRGTTAIWSLPDRIVVSTSGNPSLQWSELSAVSGSAGWSRNRPVYVKEAYSVGIPPTWEFDDLPNKYASRVTAFMVDEASFEVWGGANKIRPVPSEIGVRTSYRAGASEPKVEFDLLTSQITISGRLPTTMSRLDTLAMPQPNVTAAKILGRGFRTLDSVPTGDPTITLHSAPLIEIVKLCLQPSNNQLGEQLLMMGAARDPSFDSQDAYHSAAKELQSFLTQKVGIDESAIHPYDGSGMSRHNLITPRALTQVLSWASRQPWSEQFMDALAKPGIGTLKSRLDGVEFFGKTGSLNEVDTICGYLTTRSGERLLVSIMVNGSVVSASKVRAFSDELIKTVVNTYGTGLSFAATGPHANEDSSIFPYNLVADPVGHWLH